MLAIFVALATAASTPRLDAAAEWERRTCPGTPRAATLDPEGSRILVTSSAARRRFNDDRLRHFGGHDRMVAFVCECGDASCTKTIMLPASEYETRSRSGPVVHESHHAASASG